MAVGCTDLRKGAAGNSRPYCDRSSVLEMGVAMASLGCMAINRNRRSALSPCEPLQALVTELPNEYKNVVERSGLMKLR